MAINPEIAQTLGYRIRVRVCGIIIKDDSILLINHKGLYGHDFWSFPGGGLEFGQSVHDQLKTEFREECGIEIDPGELAFSCNVRRPPLHALELVFNIRGFEGLPEKGFDPERGKNQIISDLQFFKWDKIDQLPAVNKHPVFNRPGHASAIQECSGFFDFT